MRARGSTADLRPEFRNFRINVSRATGLLLDIQESISRMGERERFPENIWYLLLAGCSTFT
jgi:hypothetical protein